MKTTTQESSQDYLMNSLQNADTKEDFILTFWIFWVESVTLNERDFQKVAANAMVNHWFIRELAKLESAFKQYIKAYPDTQGRDKDWLYVKCVNKLLSRSPKALLEAAKKRELRPQKIKVAGINIELSIVNQN